MATLLSTLKPLCAAFHKKTSGDLTVNSVDLFLVAANNARRNAELRHNFELSRVRGTLSIDGVSGGSLANVVLDETLPGSVVVSGATSPTTANGTYQLSGTFNSKPLYSKLDSASSAVSYFLFYQTIGTDGWEICTTNDFPDHGSDPSKFFLASTATSPIGLTLVGSSSFTGNALVSAGSVYSSLKEIVAVTRLRNDQSETPLDFTRQDIAIERERTELEFDDDERGTWRYPSDAQIEARTGTPSLVQRGRKLFIYPTDNEVDSPVDVIIYGYGMLADYATANLTDAVPTDFFVEWGSEYLQWAIICELNFYFKTYVPRTEGNLSPPEQAREKAWRDLLLWDTYQVDSNVTRSR